MYLASEMQSGFTILDHPSDLGIEARGSTLAEAFVRAAEGLMSVILDLSTVRSTEIRPIEIEAPDPSQLLVRWLTEILYLYDGLEFIAKNIALEEFSSTSLRAVVRGERLDPSRHRTHLDVKAITYHQLEVSGGPEGGLVRVFLDI